MVHGRAGGQFGDESINAATTSISQSAVYASLDSEDPNRMVLVAINRTSAAKTAKGLRMCIV